MTNTERLFNAMATYQRERAAARDEFMQTMARYANEKGTAAYNRQLEIAQRKRDEAVTAAQNEARVYVNAALAAMREAVNERKMEPPTAEQLRILQMLKMRDVVTRAEMDAAANAMDGNGSALAVLDEMARRFEAEHTRTNEYGKTVPVEYYGNYKDLAVKGLGQSDGLDLLRNITKACSNMINDRVGAARAARIAAERHNKNVSAAGQNWETSSASVWSMSKGNGVKPIDLDTLPAAPIADNERDFYAGILNTPYDVLVNTLND